MAIKDNDISDLIPDYCNNRLDADEKTAFEKFLQEDDKLLDECNDFQEFQKLYHQIDPTEPAPSDAIFHQISQKVSAHQKGETKAVVQSSKLVESIYQFWQQIRQSMSVPWMLATAQAVVIVLLLIPAPQQNTYSTLSATEGAANAERIGINVVFQPNAQESDMRSLLHSIQGSVSSGPSNEGRYVIRISKQSDLESTMQKLKQSKIVLFAEPVY